MIRFLFKGILRDPKRSRLPIIVVSIGVFLTVLLSTWLGGVFGDMVDMNARFDTGHVKIMTRAYAENSAQLPNDLALLGTEALIDSLETVYPDMDWTPRIRFGGLMDVPDANGETRAQGPAGGLAVDLLSPNTHEIDRLDIAGSLVRGRLPQAPGEALISDAFAHKLNLEPGEAITFFGSTMYGSMSFYNFTVVGTIRFGSVAMDRGTIIVDIEDARQALDMQDAAGEVLGYFGSGRYDDARAVALRSAFNAAIGEGGDEFTPEMLALRDQNDLAGMMDYMDVVAELFVFIFVGAMAVVLWNTGLLGGLRRYTEFGIRLALGEAKGAIYRSLLLEAVLIGLIGSVIGTLAGLGLSAVIQHYGLDFGSMVPNTGMMLPTVYRTKITAQAFYIGFFPGVLSMVLGNALAGIGIYKRQTARLFKELEV